MSFTSEILRPDRCLSYGTIYVRLGQGFFTQINHIAAWLTHRNINRCGIQFICIKTSLCYLFVHQISFLFLKYNAFSSILKRPPTQQKSTCCDTPPVLRCYACYASASASSRLPPGWQFKRKIGFLLKRCAASIFDQFNQNKAYIEEILLLYRLVIHTTLN